MHLRVGRDRKSQLLSIPEGSVWVKKFSRTWPVVSRPVFLFPPLTSRLEVWGSPLPSSSFCKHLPISTHLLPLSQPILQEPSEATGPVRRRGLEVSPGAKFKCPPHHLSGDLTNCTKFCPIIISLCKTRTRSRCLWVSGHTSPKGPSSCSGICLVCSITKATDRPTEGRGSNTSALRAVR